MDLGNIFVKDVIFKLDKKLLDPLMTNQLMINLKMVIMATSPMVIGMAIGVTNPMVTTVTNPMVTSQRRRNPNQLILLPSLITQDAKKSN